LVGEGRGRERGHGSVGRHEGVSRK